MGELRQEFEIGEIVILDNEYPNYSAVEVVYQTPQKLYTKVRNEEGGEWEVMTIRLTKQKKD